MGTLRDTAWPPEFGAPAHGGLEISYHEDEMLRSGSEIAGQIQNPLKHPLRINIRWDFTDVWFEVFEGWYRYNLWRGIRGCTMPLEIAGVTRTFSVFFTEGYAATPVGGTTTTWYVTATVFAVEI